MGIRSIAALAERTMAISRRGSLRVLGGAALAGATVTDEHARAADAGKKGQKRCKRQQGQCSAVIRLLCQDAEAFNTCESIFLPCCKHFASCDARSGLECLIAGDGEELLVPAAPDRSS